MSMPFNPRWLLGRTIVAVELNRFRARESPDDRTMTSNPTLFLDNGASLSFFVDETDGDGYGISLIYTSPAREPGPDAVHLKPST